MSVATDISGEASNSTRCHLERRLRDLSAAVKRARREVPDTWSSARPETTTGTGVLRSDLRTPEVSDAASKVATNPDVRFALVRLATLKYVGPTTQDVEIGR